jgi:hypothetical protein
MNLCILSAAISFYKDSLALKNHKEYAIKYNYGYGYASDSTLNSLNYSELSFLRFGLIKSYLSQYDYVAWISADALFHKNCPAIPLNGDIQLAKDSSGFFNFGFGVYKNTDYVKEFLNEIINSKRELYNIYTKEYEVNRIFNYSQDNFDIHELPKEWNNTFDASLDYNVIHYSRELKSYKKDIMNSDIIDSVLSV